MGVFEMKLFSTDTVKFLDVRTMKSKKTGHDFQIISFGEDSSYTRNLSFFKRDDYLSIVLNLATK